MATSAAAAPQQSLPGKAVGGTGQPAQPVVPLQIRVTEGADDGLGHALYDIELQLGPNYTWRVSHRYSEFLDLEKTLSPMLSEEEKAAFPPKHVLSSSRNPDVVAERLRLLPQFLMMISAHPSVSTHPAFRGFLALTEHEAALRAAQRGEYPRAAAPAPATAAAVPQAAGGAGIAAKQQVPVAQETTKQLPAAKPFGVGASAREPAQPALPASSLGKPEPKAQPQAKAAAAPVAAAPQEPEVGSESAGDATLPLVETARLVQGPADSGGILDSQVSATGVATAPPAAHSEFATSTTSVDVRLPSLAVPESVAGELATARRGMADAQRELEEAARLRARSVYMEARSEELGQEASQAMRGVTHAREAELALEKRAAAMARDAAALEEAAAAKRREAAALASQLRSAHEDVDSRAAAGEQLMNKYNDALAAAQRAAAEAAALAADAERRRLAAVETLERAAAEVAEREGDAALQSQQELVRQAAFAAAAAARAKHEIAAAAAAKAAEEAAVARAHALAHAEAEAQAQMLLAQERLYAARRKKDEASAAAAAASAEAHADTEAAAHDAAEVDARTRAVELVRIREREAEALMRRAEDDWLKGERLRLSIIAQREKEAGHASITGGSVSAPVPVGKAALISGGAGGASTASSVASTSTDALDALSTRSVAGSDVAAGPGGGVSTRRMDEFVGMSEGEVKGKDKDKGLGAAPGRRL